MRKNTEKRDLLRQNTKSWQSNNMQNANTKRKQSRIDMIFGYFVHINTCKCIPHNNTLKGYCTLSGLPDRDNITLHLSKEREKEDILMDMHQSIQLQVLQCQCHMKWFDVKKEKRTPPPQPHTNQIYKRKAIVIQYCYGNAFESFYAAFVFHLSFEWFYMRLSIYEPIAALDFGVQ